MNATRTNPAHRTTATSPATLPIAATEIHVGGAACRRRDPRDVVWRGVCAELAWRMDLDPLLVRLLFVVANALPGLGLVLYLVLAARFDRAGAIAPRPRPTGRLRDRLRLAGRRGRAGRVVVVA